MEESEGADRMDTGNGRAEDRADLLVECPVLHEALTDLRARAQRVNTRHIRWRGGSMSQASPQGPPPRKTADGRLEADRP